MGHHVAVLLRRRPTGERGAVLLLVAVAAVPMVALAWARYRLHLPTGDEPHYLVISQALAAHGSLDVQGVYDRREYWAFSPIWLEPHVSPGPDGRPLPLHSIGGPVLWLVPFLIWGRAGAVAFMVAVSLGIVANVYLLVRQLDVARRTALAVGLAFAVGTPILTYSAMSFVEPIGALGCLYALRVLHRREVRPRDLLLASAGLGVLPWVHSRFLLFPPLFLAFLLLRALREPGPGRGVRVLCVLAPAAVLLLGLEVYHALVWGTLDLAPNQVNAGAVPFRANPLRALGGTLLDQEVGVVPNFPIFLFALPGLLLSASRRYLALHVHVLAAVVPYLLVVCSFPAWDGAWSPPARFMAVVLPLLAGHVALALDRAGGVLTRVLAGAAATVGAVLTAVAVHTPDGGFSAQRGYSPSLQLIDAATALDLTRFVPSAALDGQLPLFLGWLLAGLGLTAAVWWRGRAARPGRPEVRP